MQLTIDTIAEARAEILALKYMKTESKLKQNGAQVYILTYGLNSQTLYNGVTPFGFNRFLLVYISSDIAI